jgi:cytochrome c-type biogenesis protein CcmH
VKRGRMISRLATAFALLMSLFLVLRVTPAAAQAVRDAEALAETAASRVGPPAGPPRSGALLEAELEAVASRLRCPTCQGLSVAASPSASARAMREETAVLLSLGYSGDQVLAYWEGSYGEFVRLVPKARGLNLLVFLLPVLGVALGVLLVARRARSVARQENSPVDAELEQYRQRIRESLK